VKNPLEKAWLDITNEHVMVWFQTGKAVPCAIVSPNQGLCFTLNQSINQSIITRFQSKD
jgi:hypothetical protein